MSLVGKAIEIVSFPASEAYQKDVHEVDGALKVLRTKTPHPYACISNFLYRELMYLRFWVGLGTKEPKLYGFIRASFLKPHISSCSLRFFTVQHGIR